MLLLPVKNPNGRDWLIVVLGSTNVERMRRADPVQIENFGGTVLINPKVMICYEDSSPELNRLVQSGDVAKLVEHLTRGFEYRPDLGDHDNGPQSIKDSN